MMQFRPVTAITKLDGWPIDGVEINIVFTHELVKADILGIEPPFFPMKSVVGCDTRVSNRRVKLERHDEQPSWDDVMHHLPRHL